MKVLVLINDTTYAYNLRGAILKRLIAQGHEVLVVCKVLSMGKELEDMGCNLVNVDNGRRGTNPLADLALINRYRKILNAERPDVVLTYNIKPNIYGGMLCKRRGIKYIPTITGLGMPIENPSRFQKLILWLYTIGVSGASCVFFQNEENRRFFLEHGILKPGARTRMLPGSGVDLERHPLRTYRPGETVHFLFAARIMKEKGIDLYLNAAKRIHTRHENAVFHICGMCDDPRYIEVLKEEGHAGYIEYHGEQADLRPFLDKAHCIVHPSYYPEGMSNILLEAAAHGRPLIATDRAGCREAVDDGISGWIIPVQNEEKLVEALENFMAMSWKEREAMGKAGRAKMEKEYDRQIVVEAYLEEMSG